MVKRTKKMKFKFEAQTAEHPKAAGDSVNVALGAKFPLGSTLCAFCDVVAVDAAGLCLNCGRGQPATNIPADNHRAAEAGKGVLAQPMPIQFTARELAALHVMLCMEATRAQMRKEPDQKECEILHSMHTKTFAVVRAWWDDAEAATRMWSLIEKVQKDVEAGTSRWTAEQQNASNKPQP